MKMSFKYSLYFLALSGCSYSENKPPNNALVIETISSYDYEYFCGINAAVNQFGSKHSDLVIDLSTKRVLTYVADSYNNGYADGYHKALDVIVSRDSKQCPDFH
jgi:CDGSH-type Zn-finger protein